MLITHELTIDAPVDEVWALTADVESWPRMTPTITSVQLLDDLDLQVGSRARVRQPWQRPAVWTVTTLQPGVAFVWETSTLGLRMVGAHHLEPVDGGCRNTLSIELIGRGAGLAGRLIGRRIRRALATENDGFRRAAEGVAR